MALGPFILLNFLLKSELGWILHILLAFSQTKIWHDCSGHLSEIKGILLTMITVATDELYYIFTDLDYFQCLVCHIKYYGLAN